eukprot:SAG22_NODE_20273_length_267_cov_0.613095_1_plen_34_part_10
MFEQRLDLPKETAALCFESFPCVCPEPVLVKWSV